MRKCNDISSEWCKPNGYGGQVGGLLMVDHNGDRYLPGYDIQGNVVSLVSESTGAMVAGFDAARKREDGHCVSNARRVSDSGCPLGGIVKQYDPYGRIIRMEGATDKIPFRYQSKWDMDYGTEATSQFSWGLVDYGLRFYQPKHGRFINRDPIGEAGGLNLYEAFGGDPLNRWDLLGLKPSISINHIEKTVTITTEFYFRPPVRSSRPARDLHFRYRDNFLQAYRNAFKLQNSDYSVTANYTLSQSHSRNTVTVDFYHPLPRSKAGSYITGIETLYIQSGIVSKKSTEGNFLLLNTIAHEIGHGLRLGHVEDKFNVMHDEVVSDFHQYFTMDQFELAVEIQEDSIPWYRRIFRRKSNAIVTIDEEYKVLGFEIDFITAEWSRDHPMGSLPMPSPRLRGFSSTSFGTMNSYIDQKLFELKFPAYASMLREGKGALVDSLMHIDRLHDKYDLEH